MRLCLSVKVLLIFLFLVIPATTAEAMTTLETDISGINPTLYGDILVFEQDNEIKIFNIKTDEIKTISKGNNPSLFANKIVFQTQENQINEDLNDDKDKLDTIIQYYDIKEEIVYNLGLLGENPTIYFNKISFSVNEKDFDINLNNDQDKEDDIILFYDLETKKLANTNAVGNYPSTGPEFIIFETQEKQYGSDLNKDGDKEDTVIRTYQFETGGVENSYQAGKKPQNDEDFAVFTSSGKIIIYNAKSGEIIKTNLKGENPVKHKNIIVYNDAGKFYTYNLETETCAKTEIDGRQPSLFDFTLAFVDDKIKILKSEDLDNDKVPDIIDNCKETSDKNQTDIDNDCIGDICDAKIDISKTEKLSVDTSGLGNVQENQKIQEPKQGEKSKSNTKTMFIYVLIALALILFLIYYFRPKQRQKRKKGFGF